MIPVDLPRTYIPLVLSIQYFFGHIQLFFTAAETVECIR